MRMVLVLMLLLSSASLLAQSSDWSNVEAVAPGTRLIITTHRRLACVVDGVSEGGIACAFNSRTFWIDRSRINQVHLHRTGKGVLIATTVGAAAGGSLAAVADGDPIEKGTRVLAGGALGGFVGFLVGHSFDRSDGQLLYRRP